MGLKSYTFDEVAAWDNLPSSIDFLGALKEVYDDRERLTALDWMDADGLAEDDKLTLVLREEVISIRHLKGLACDFAERVAYLVDDPFPVKAIKTMRRWLEGKTTDRVLGKVTNGIWTWLREVDSSYKWGALWDAGCAAASATSGTGFGAIDAARHAAWAVEEATRSEFKSKPGEAIKWAMRAEKIERMVQLRMVRKVLVRMSEEE